MCTVTYDSIGPHLKMFECICHKSHAFHFAFYFTTYNNLFVLVLKSTNFVGVSWQMIFLLIGVVHEALFHIWPPA